jgi:hypothetical protein
MTERLDMNDYVVSLSDGRREQVMEFLMYC